MSKKKRLGRGLEALLGVGSKSTSDGPAEERLSASPDRDIELTSPGTEIHSSDELIGETPALSSPIVETESDDEPAILKFSSRPTGRPSASGAFTPSGTPGSFGSPGSSGMLGTPASGISKGTGTLAGNNSGSALPAGSGGFGKDSESGLVASTSPSEEEDAGRVVELNVYDVDDNPFQPRREFNKSEIESLAESLKTHEQLQPILVRRVGDRYQLISGERRLRAAIHAGWSKIRAQVREADDRLVAELAIVENLQRKDLNPVEKALSFRRYLDQHGCSQEDLAGRLKIDRSTVANLLRLLDLPEVVQKAIQVGIISNGHARALLPLGEEHLQIEFCNRIQREGLSVRAIEQLVRDRIDEEDGIKRKPTAKKRTKSGQILSLETELRNALGTKVEIKSTSRGRGKIVVHYLSGEEFERLRALLSEGSGQKRRDVA